MSAFGYRKPADLPQTIPLFPLVGAILMPRGVLALNVFEPRYLNMVDDALGGDLYKAVGVNVSYLLPWQVTTDYGVRLHAFGTAGNLLNVKGQCHPQQLPPLQRIASRLFGLHWSHLFVLATDGVSLTDIASEWRSGLKASVGGGLLIPTPIGRFELNLAHPFALGGDNVDVRTQKFQIGLGYRFL